VHLFELVVVGCVSDRCEVKDRIEPLVAELFSPIQSRQVLRYKIAAVAGEILEIAGAKVVDQGHKRIREFFLQRQREIGSDETGATRDNEVGRRVQFSENENWRDIDNS